MARLSRKASLQKLKDVLLKRRDALRQALAGDLSSLKELRGHPGGDTLDVALDSAHDEINSQLAEMESRELTRIEEALERMRNGTYGICKITGKPIPMARLQALPYATTRVDAQRALERAGGGGSGSSDFGALIDPDVDIDSATLSDYELA
jgi:DnaK suppressor protein